MTLLLSVTPRDAVPGMPMLDGAALSALVERYERAGWRGREAREARSDDVRALGSSWAKRLGIPDRRGAVVLRLAPGGILGPLRQASSSPA